MRLLTGLLLGTAVALAQGALTHAASGDPVGALSEFGVSAALSIAVLYFWRQDRQDRAAENKRRDEAYETIARGYRELVQANTEATTRLYDLLRGRPCIATREEREQH